MTSTSRSSNKPTHPAMTEQPADATPVEFPDDSNRNDDCECCDGIRESLNETNAKLDAVLRFLGLRRRTSVVETEHRTSDTMRDETKPAPPPPPSSSADRSEYTHRFESNGYEYAPAHQHTGVVTTTGGPGPIGSISEQVHASHEQWREDARRQAEERRQVVRSAFGQWLHDNSWVKTTFFLMLFVFSIVMIVYAEYGYELGWRSSTSSVRSVDTDTQRPSKGETVALSLAEIEAGDFRIYVDDTNRIVYLGVHATTEDRAWAADRSLDGYEVRVVGGSSAAANRESLADVLRQLEDRLQDLKAEAYTITTRAGRQAIDDSIAYANRAIGMAEGEHSDSGE